VIENRLRTAVAPVLIVAAGCASLALELTHLTSIDQFLAAVRDVSLSLAGVLLLALGLRLVRSQGASLSTVAFPIVGLVILGLLIASCLFTARFFDNAAELAQDPTGERIESNAANVISDPDSPLDKRIRASRFRARAAFVRSGRILPVLDESGSEAPFRPTEQDIDARVVREQLRLLSPQFGNSARRSLYVLVILTVASILIGIGTPVRGAPAA